MPHIHAATERLAAALGRRAAARGEPVNVTQDMSEATLDVVLLALVRRRPRALAAAHGGNPFALLTDHTARNLAFAYKFRQLGKLIMDDVARRRRDGVRRNDIVSLLLDARDRQSGEPMSDRELLDEIMTLIVAGHETTASSLNWFWYLLTQSPDVEARIHAEVDAADGRACPSYDALARFPYVRRALDETLRLYPPGWLLTRRSIAARTHRRLCAARGHRRADLALPRAAASAPTGSDPDAFDPDRFLPDAAAARNRFVYLPFGLGPRACIGEHLAIIEMHAHAIMLARRFALTPRPGPDDRNRAAGQPAHAAAGLHAA